MKQMKVLIVDDNEKIRALVRDYLPASFDQISECADGADALRCYEANRPDWVLMDWEMPIMNGITATREIIAEFPRANICMVTAFKDEELRHAALSAGARGFVMKNRLLELETILDSDLKH